MFPFLSNPFLFNSTDDQSDLMLLIYHSAKKCKKTLYNRCTLSVLWIRKLPLQSALVPDGSRGFHQALRWSIYEAGCCGRTGSLLNSDMENSCLFIPSTFHAFTLIIFPHIHSKVSNFQWRALYCSRHVKRRDRVKTELSVWRLWLVAQHLKTPRHLCSVQEEEGGLGLLSTDAYYSHTKWRQIDNTFCCIPGLTPTFYAQSFFLEISDYWLQKVSSHSLVIVKPQ